MPRSFSFSIASLTTACLAAACFAPPALAQGVFKPLDTLIVNPPSRPVPVQVLSAPMPAGEGSRTPFRVLAQLQISAGNVECTELFTLPAGKRLVLTYVGGFASLPAPAALSYVAVGLFEAGVHTGHVIVVPAAPPLPEGSNNLAAAGQQVHAYIDVPLRMCVRTAGVVSGSSVFVQLSGYLVDKP